jgi:hypothetical protein
MDERCSFRRVEYREVTIMSLRVLVGWIIGILGVLVVLAAFGLDFGLRAPVSFAGQVLIGIILVIIGVALATGRPAITS